MAFTISYLVAFLGPCIAFISLPPATFHKKTSKAVQENTQQIQQVKKLSAADPGVDGVSHLWLTGSKSEWRVDASQNFRWRRREAFSTAITTRHLPHKRALGWWTVAAQPIRYSGLCLASSLPKWSKSLMLLSCKASRLRDTWRVPSHFIKTLCHPW